MKNPVVSTVPQGNPFVALGRELLAKLDSEQADFATPRSDQLPGFHPVPNQCHDNADRWVNANRGDLVLRGWLLDAKGDPDTHSPYRFLAHSVVLTARGNLIDVTLPATERSRRFLVHPYGICGFFGSAVPRGPRPPGPRIQGRIRHTGRRARGGPGFHSGRSHRRRLSVSSPSLPLLLAVTGTPPPCMTLWSRASGPAATECAQTVSCVQHVTRANRGASR